MKPEDLTLRDYFAASAIPAFMATLKGEDPQRLLRLFDKCGVADAQEWLAQQSYKLADTMLQERAK